MLKAIWQCKQAATTSLNGKKTAVQMYTNFADRSDLGARCFGRTPPGLLLQLWQSSQQQ